MINGSNVTFQILRLRSEVAAADVRLKFLRLVKAFKYDPNQPRVPAGNPDGGQWTSTGNGGDVNEFTSTNDFTQDDGLVVSDDVEAGLNDPRVLSDFDYEEEWIPNAEYASSRPDGHHFLAQSIYRDLPLSPETRKVFEDAKTGRLSAPGHQFDTPHRQYNIAVRELFDKFMSVNGLRPEDIKPDHARAIVKEIKESRDPRIRNYNMGIYMREIRNQLRRVPRGSE